MLDLRKKINLVILLILPSIVLLCLFITNSEKVLKLTNLDEINEIFFIKLMILTFLLLLLSSILFSVASFVMLYSAYNRIQFKINIYRSFIFFLVIFDVFIVCLYYYFNIKSDTNLSIYLTHKINEININPLNNIAIRSMNNIQNYFICCGYNSSADYLNATEFNSCQVMDKIILPTISSSSNKFRSMFNFPSENTGCYGIISHYLNEDLLALIIGTGILAIFKIVGMADTCAVYESRLIQMNNETQIEFCQQNLLNVDAQQQQNSGIGFQANDQTIFNTSNSYSQLNQDPPDYNSIIKNDPKQNN